MLDDESDDLIQEAIKVVCQYDRASASLLQRRLCIGYARAARLIDQLESLKVLSASEGGSRPRQVLIQNAEEFIKEISQIKREPQEATGIEYKEYKPKKALFLPKDFLNLKDPKELILGYDKKGKSVKTDFDEIAHLLVVGSPISKKYEFIENFLLSTLSNFTPKQLSLVVYDSTYSFSKYSKVPHYLSPLINGWDKAISALRWSLAETDRRLKLKTGGSKEKFPKIYFVYNFDFVSIEIEDALKMLTSRSHRAGIHLIICTDQLADIPKSVRDNIPVRLTFDKFGDYKANYEFKEKVSLATVPIKGREVDKYLKNI